MRLPMCALVAGLALGASGCTSNDQPAPDGEEGAPAEADPTPSRGTSIIVAGVPFDIGAPVVTWKDPQGYDAYSQRCAFSDDVLPTSPAPGCDTPERYSEGGRRRLEPALAEVVAARGWTPELLALHLTQVVVHYDAAWTSRNCFKVLHDQRGLSCHFLLDLDGTLYQTLDLTERARHAGAANDLSVGIEIAHPGVLASDTIRAAYSQDATGAVLDLGPFAGDLPPGFVARPARPDPVEGLIHGKPYAQYDFTEAQYETLAALVGALAELFPRMPLEVPRDPGGEILWRVLTPEELASFRGVIGHYHVSVHKQDPGPAFRWERLLELARARPAPQRGD
ncbi:MAG: peptidoglycan recognition family protein [Planctomycetota bacterium]